MSAVLLPMGKSLANLHRGPRDRINTSILHSGSKTKDKGSAVKPGTSCSRQIRHDPGRLSHWFGEKKSKPSCHWSLKRSRFFDVSLART